MSLCRTKNSLQCHIGIFRSFGAKVEFSNDGFVWTNPSPDTKIRPCDLIFVLATKEYGKKAYESNLLPLSGKAIIENMSGLDIRDIPQRLSTWAMGPPHAAA